MALQITSTQPKEEEQKRSLSKKMLLGISIALSAFLSVALLFLLVLPQWGRVGEGKEFDVQALEQQVAEREALLAQIKQLRENFETIEQDQVNSLSRMLPQEQDVPELLAQLEAIARQSGMNLLAVNMTEVDDSATVRGRQAAAQQETKRPAGVKALSIQVEVGAFSYPAYKQFISALQSHIRLFDVQQFAYASDNDNHSMTLLTYYLAD